MIKMEYRLLCVMCIVGIRLRYTIKYKDTGVVHEFGINLWVKIRGWSKEFLLKNLKLERDFRIFMKME